MYLKVHYAKVAFVANNVAGDENLRMEEEKLRT